MSQLASEVQVAPREKERKRESVFDIFARSKRPMKEERTGDTASVSTGLDLHNTLGVSGGRSITLTKEGKERVESVSRNLISRRNE